MFETLWQDLLAVGILGGFAILMYAKWSKQTLKQAFEELKQAINGE